MSPQDLFHLSCSIADVLNCEHDPNVEISNYFISMSARANENDIDLRGEVKNEEPNTISQAGDVNVPNTISETVDASVSNTILQPGERNNSNTLPDLLASSDLYRAALTIPDPDLVDITLSELLQNNPSIDFSHVLSRSYSSMRNKVSGRFQLTFPHLMIKKRSIYSFYEVSDRLDVDEIYALALNHARDSELVTSSLCVLRLLGVDEACLITHVRGVRGLSDEDLGKTLYLFHCQT